MLPLLLLAMVLLATVDGKMTVTVTLGMFTARGLRCDWFLPCDFKFTICIDDVLVSSGNRISPCTFTSRSTGRMGPAPIDLSLKLTPIVFQMDVWKGVRLKVRVLDHDQYSGDDEIDFLSTTYLGPVGRRMDTVMAHKTRLSVTFTSACSPFYYGPSCNTLCVPQNNNFNGHYICEPVLGTKICLAGWTGVNCNMTVKTTKINIGDELVKIPYNASVSTTTSTTIAHSTTARLTTTPTAIRTLSNNVYLITKSPKSSTPVSVSIKEHYTTPTDADEVENSTDFELNASDLDYAIKKLIGQFNSTHDKIIKDATNMTYEHFNNTPRSWLCGRLSLTPQTSSSPTGGKIDFGKISKVEESLKLFGNISLSISLDEHFQCNGSLVEVFLVDYCWNTLQSRSSMEHIIRNKFNDVFGYLFEFLNKELCFNSAASKDSTNEIMYSIWGSLAVVIVAVLIAVIIIYRRRKKCHTISSDAKFMFLFRKAPSNSQQMPKSADDKLNILPAKVITN